MAITRAKSGIYKPRQIAYQVTDNVKTPNAKTPKANTSKPRTKTKVRDNKVTKPKKSAPKKATASATKKTTTAGTMKTTTVGTKKVTAIGTKEATAIGTKKATVKKPVAKKQAVKKRAAKKAETTRNFAPSAEVRGPTFLAVGDVAFAVQDFVTSNATSKSGKKVCVTACFCGMQFLTRITNVQATGTAQTEAVPQKDISSVKSTKASA